jgi:hypothetical protein
MEPPTFTDAELELVTERCHKYQGTARINLDQICFQPNISRTLDRKNVDRLYEIFKKEGCRRFDVQNHVTATVSRQDLQIALQAARVSSRELLTNPPKEFPRLNFPTGQLHGLHGQHRIQAATELLNRDDRWWTVDIYLDGTMLFVRLLTFYKC